MAIASRISPHLPYLRRFARALSGSQQRGDGLVASMLQAILEKRIELRDDLAPRIALYRAFVNWLKIDSLQTSTAIEATLRPAADRMLAELTHRSRLVFLLKSVEGFSTSETAQILDCDPREVDADFSAAGHELAQQLATQVLIIEDEPLIAADLEDLVADLGHQTIGVARTHAEAIAHAARNKPGLILADIQLADGSSGLSATNEIVAKLSVPIIFITAYPERLLTGEKPEPAFLITKPFNIDMIKAVISQALFFDTRAHRSY